MKKQFAVIGLGRFGTEVVRILSEKGYDVIAIDKDPARVKAVADEVTLAIELDATDEKALQDAGVQNVDVAIVSIGEHIEASIFVVMILKELGIKEIVAKALNELYGRILSQLGVNKVVHPERDMARKIAYSLISPEFLDHIELSPEYSIVELPVPDFLINRSIMDTNLRATHGITIIAIKSGEAPDTDKMTWNINPLPSDMIKNGDILVMLGANTDIEQLGWNS